MPYFKNEDGAKGHTNNEEVMARLEEAGYVRLEGKELLWRIVHAALKSWGIPALCVALVFNAWPDIFALSLVTFVTVQQILD